MVFDHSEQPSKLQVSHRHHFIPCFYLKQWVGIDGKLQVWSRPNKEVISCRKRPKGVAWQDDLYTFQGLPVSARQWFEDEFLQRVDDLAAKALQKMENTHSTVLDNELRSAWSRFIIGLWYRHPDVLEELKNIIRAEWHRRKYEGRDRFEDWAREQELNVTFEDFLAQCTEERDTISHVKALKAVMDNTIVGNRLINMPWEVFDVSKGDFSLLTSDCPTTIALSAKPPHVCIPINPRKVFVASEDPQLFRGLRATKANDLARYLNHMVVARARRFVFGINDHHSCLVQKRMSENMAKPPFFPSFDRTDVD